MTHRLAGLALLAALALAAPSAASAAPAKAKPDCVPGKITAPKAGRASCAIVGAKTKRPPSRAQVMARAAVRSPTFTYLGSYPSRGWAKYTSGPYAGTYYYIDYWRYIDEYNLHTNELYYWWNGSRAVYWGHYQCQGFGREFNLGCHWYTSKPTGFPY